MQMNELKKEVCSLVTFIHDVYYLEGWQAADKLWANVASNLKLKRISVLATNAQLSNILISGVIDFIL